MTTIALYGFCVEEGGREEGGREGGRKKGRGRYSMNISGNREIVPVP